MGNTIVPYGRDFLIQSNPLPKASPFLSSNFATRSRSALAFLSNSASPLPAVSAPVEEPTGPLSERIKTSVTVLEFVGRYVDLQPTANGAIGRCPFHDDHRPSFGINDEGNYWNCWAGCGGGSVIDFWMKWRECDFAAAIRELAEMLM